MHRTPGPGTRGQGGSERPPTPMSSLKKSPRAGAGVEWVESVSYKQEAWVPAPHRQGNSHLSSQDLADGGGGAQVKGHLYYTLSSSLAWATCYPVSKSKAGDGEVVPKDLLHKTEPPSWASSTHLRKHSKAKTSQAGHGDGSMMMYLRGSLSLRPRTNGGRRKPTPKASSDPTPTWQHACAPPHN